MKRLFLTAAIVLPALVCAFWPSEAADLPGPPGTAVESFHSTSDPDSLIEAARAFIPEAFVQESKLVAADGAQGDRLGFDVAIDGNTAVVGSPLDDIGSNANQGSAYVFVRTGSSWVMQQRLTAPDGAANDVLGVRVAIDGETAVVSTVANTLAGAAYVFVRNGTVWNFQQKLTASDRAPNDRFGIGLDIDGNTVIVGATFVDGNLNPSQGAAYIYIRTGSVWTEQQKVVAPGGGSRFFGEVVAVLGDTAVVGTPFVNTSAYIYTRSGSTWTFTQLLKYGDSFGGSVDIQGNTLVVGTGNDTVNEGAVYVFTRAGSDWVLQQRLTPSDSTPEDDFGVSVGIEGNVLVVGKGNRSIADTIGAAYIFHRTGSTWTEQQKLTVIAGGFGPAVAISGSSIIVGVNGDDFGSITDQGSAYIFRDTGGPAPTPTPTPTPTPIPIRNLRIETSYVAAPGLVSVPITLITSAGNERTISFSLSYETSRLGSPSFACGPDAPGCTIMPNTSTPGFIGVTVTFVTLPTPGERRILTLTFASSIGGASNTPVLFTDMPTPRVTRNAAGTALATGYTGGSVVFTERGLEGDLATRFTGDGFYRSNDVEQMRAFVSGIEQPNALTNEFERADVAPYGTKGDGLLRADDFQLVKNYVANLVAQQTAGGPDAPIPRGSRHRTPSFQKCGAWDENSFRRGPFRRES